MTSDYSKNCSINLVAKKNTLPGIGSVVEVVLIFVAVAVEVVDVVEVVTVVELDVEFESEI